MASFWRSRDNRTNDLNDEMRAHLDMAIRERIARGEAPQDAERNAIRDFGDVVTVRETTSDMWGPEWPSETMRDLRHAVRSLSRVPGFAIAAVLTLALGIGANTAIFSVINGVLLKELPYPKPRELVYITTQFPTMGFNQFAVDAAEFLEFRERNQSFQAVGAYAVGAVNVGTDASPQREISAVASASLFDALGVPPLRGREFRPEETLPNSQPVVILSREVWQSAFGGRELIGQQVQIDGVARTVVGIMPGGFDVHDQHVKVWLPLRLDPAQRTQYRGGHYLYLIGRLRDNVTFGQAKSELKSLVAQWVVADGGTAGATCCGPGFVHAPSPEFHPVRYDELQADMIGGIGRALWILQAAVAFVLLIACANLANLLLMRAETRHKELAVRAALGAGRGRLIRQFLAESAVLSLAGAAVGTALAEIGLRALVSRGASSIPRAAQIAIDGRVLAFTLALAIGTGLIFGLAPALHMTMSNLGLSLRDAGSRTATVGGRNRVRRGLVIAEMALAVMLVIGAGLLLRSFWNLMNVDAGFDRSHLTTFQIALPPRVYTDSVRRVQFFDNLTRQLSAVPGVQRVAAMSGLPPLRPLNANDTQFEGYMPLEKTDPPNNVQYIQYATPAYFETMRIPIVAGRGFGPEDGPLSNPVLVINQTIANLYYKGIDAVGRRIKPNGDTLWFTIIGIAKDVKQGGLGAATGTELYIDYEQTPRTEGFATPSMNVVIRSTLDKSALAPSIRRIVGALDASLPIVKLRSMDDVFETAVSQPHFLAELLGVFATVALLLSAVGTYGVLAYSITERRREIGIRMALGASAQSVLRMVLRQGMTLAAVGVVAGLAGAALLTRLTATLLFGVKPADPTTFVAVSAFMLLVAVAASFIPARRATKVDPLTALRAE
ncbi:MAG: ADOP family duplicated permease [Gemmatimonadaceae bacterium]